MSGHKWANTRILAAAMLVAAFVAARASAQTPPAALSITITPRVAAAATPRHLNVQGLAPGSSVTGALFDPYGNETPLYVKADSAGVVSDTLIPPNGAWSSGLYRAALDVGGGRSISATFAASDGQTHLLEVETLPSPFTAFNVEGTGLPAGKRLDLTLFLPGGLGQRTFPVMTDADGTLNLFIWPQELGYTFFSAGGYRLIDPGLNLEADWVVREHPVSSTVRVAGPVIPGADTTVTFDSYTPNRVLWVVYATSDGVPVGEALVGPTDMRGHTSATLTFPDLAPGTYLLATPYDWGETTFTVPAPTPTSTPTLTPTPTDTPTPTATATPVACFVTVKLAHRTVRAGRPQSVRVTTTPGVEVDLSVQFPTKNKKHRVGTADAKGSYTWTFTQPANRTTRTDPYARVVAQVACDNGTLITARDTYRIH